MTRNSENRSNLHSLLLFGSERTCATFLLRSQLELSLALHWLACRSSARHARMNAHRVSTIATPRLPASRMSLPGSFSRSCPLSELRNDRDPVN